MINEYGCPLECQIKEGGWYFLFSFGKKRKLFMRKKSASPIYSFISDFVEDHNAYLATPIHPPSSFYLALESIVSVNRCDICLKLKLKTLLKSLQLIQRIF